MDQKELERKAQLFDWLATRIAYAEIRLPFGGRHKAYPECDPKKLEAEIEEAKGFEKESDEIRAKEQEDEPTEADLKHFAWGAERGEVWNQS